MRLNITPIKQRLLKISLVLAFALLGVLAESHATVLLPKYISDHMVLQRNQRVRLSGWGGQYNKVQVDFQDKTYTGTVNRKGQWEVFLPPMQAGGPYKMRITVGQESVMLDDIMVGDVWLCMGQGMLNTVSMSPDSSDDKLVQNPASHVRIMNIPHNLSTEPVQDLAQGASWMPVDSEQPNYYPSLAYHFARNLQQQSNVPIGVVVAGWDNVMLSSWMSREAFQGLPFYTDKLKQLEYTDINSLRKRTEASGQTFSPNVAPSLVFNGMIAPLTRNAFKGVVWAVDGKDITSQDQYADLLSRHYQDLRQKLGQNNLPFVTVEVNPQLTKKLVEEKGMRKDSFAIFDKEMSEPQKARKLAQHALMF